MNPKAFTQYITNHLNTFVHIYSHTGFLVESSSPHYRTSDPFTEWTQLTHTLTDFSGGCIPRLVCVNDRILYAAAKTPDLIYVVGPVQCTGAASFRIRLYNPQIDEDWYAHVPFCKYEDLIEDILLIHNLYTEQLLRGDILAVYAYDADADIAEIQTNYSNIQFERQENTLSHNPYAQEVRLLDSIAQGDLISLEQCWKEEIRQDSYGTLSPNPLRNVKNLCISVITLASRAAIRGGLNPEISFSLCDSYVQKLEACTDSLICSAIAHECHREYTMLVASLRHALPKPGALKPTPHLNKCKNYIYAHLHEQITIEKIADAVHLNPTYLAGLFKKYEGCTIHHFILSEKMNLVKNLLKYSDYTYSEIASYLGFSSQSHLGTQFKKITGYTLREYRIKYGEEQFC